MADKNDPYWTDIENIQQIPIVKTILDIICSTTGMGFSAVARVTDDRWITCSVRDDISFGLKPGDELGLKTTICNEIRIHQNPVIIDSVEDDPNFSNHHTPAMYGFKSYISYPIIRKDGTFFGTLCAIDPHVHEVSSPTITGLFSAFADLISFHLETVEALNKSEQKFTKEREFSDELEKKVLERTQQLEKQNDELEHLNKELESFAYISSHDLQEPLRKIQSFASAIVERDFDNISSTGKDYFKRMQNAAHRMQTLINDLFTYSQSKHVAGSKTELTELDALLEEVKADLHEEIIQKKGTIISTELGTAHVIPFQMRQVLYNLIANALKFSHTDRVPVIQIATQILNHVSSSDSKLPAGEYLNLSVSDNGIGFEQEYGERIFKLFQRLHLRTEYEGTGIGLAIVKKVIDNHGGHVFASSRLGEGTRFDIYLPLKN